MTDIAQRQAGSDWVGAVTIPSISMLLVVGSVAGTRNRDHVGCLVAARSWRHSS